MSKPRIQHNMVASTENEPDFNQEEEIKTYNVAPPEDEDFVHKEQKNENIQRERAEQSLKDPVLQKEIKKKETLEKILLFKKPHTKSVEINGVEFTLKLLSSNESNEVYKELLSIPKSEQLSRTPLMLLAAALYSVDDIPFEDICSSYSDIESGTLRKYYELSQWNSPLVNALSKAYNQFRKEVEEEYSKDFFTEKS